MRVSWQPLSLSEARGFVLFYTIAYTPVLTDSMREVTETYLNASADPSSVTVEGLNGSLAYVIQVSAGTKAGQGVESPAIFIDGMLGTEY